MEGQHPGSAVRITEAPIHSILIPFPITFFITAFVADAMFWQTEDRIWAVAALVLLGAGLLIAALAAFADALGDRRSRELNDPWMHASGNVLAVLVQVVNFFRRYQAAEDAVLPWGITLSLVAVVILAFTGWNGAEPVCRHYVGAPDSPGARGT